MGSFNFRYYELIYKARLYEIRDHLRQISTLTIEVIIVLISLTAGAFIHGPYSILLLVPLITFYFLYLIFREFIFIEEIAIFIRKTVEEPLMRITGISGWEIYRQNTSSKWIKGVLFPGLIFPILELVVIVLYILSLPLSQDSYIHKYLLVIAFIYGIAIAIFWFVISHTYMKKISNR